MIHRAVLHRIKSTAFYRGLSRKKYGFIADNLRNFIPSDASHLLDFGCGDMNLDKLLSQMLPELRIVGLDVIKHDSMDISDFPNLEFQRYDGDVIPYPDNHFDCTLACAVFHHTKSPEKHLKEVVRVTRERGYVIVVEHACRIGFECKINYLNDLVRNFLVNPKIIGPITFIIEIEWEHMFEELSLELRGKQYLRPFPYYLQQVTYLLKKIKSSFF